MERRPLYGFEKVMYHMSPTLGAATVAAVVSQEIPMHAVRQAAERVQQLFPQLRSRITKHSEDRAPHIELIPQEKVEIEYKVHDFGEAYDESHQERNDLARILAVTCSRPFDPTSGCMYRVLIGKFDSLHTFVCVSADHTLADGITLMKALMLIVEYCGSPPGDPDDSGNRAPAHSKRNEISPYQQLGFRWYERLLSVPMRSQWSKVVRNSVVHQLHASKAQRTGGVVTLDIGRTEMTPYSRLKELSRPLGISTGGYLFAASICAFLVFVRQARPDLVTEKINLRDASVDFNLGARLDPPLSGVEGGFGTGLLSYNRRVALSEKIVQLCRKATSRIHGRLSAREAAYVNLASQGIENYTEFVRRSLSTENLSGPVSSLNM
ncbi:MAG TPA: hypothetical protein DG761_09090, partial [Gammaproteobacteria bacterium]|nr:hypothetical protein [Gammaproteobacteria bacterium]